MNCSVKGCNNKIFNKKYSLCRPCYGKAYQNGKIPPLPLYSTRLSTAWGAEILVDLERAKEKSMTLTALGKKYGFSREYARYIFKRIYKKGIKELDK